MMMTSGDAQPALDRVTDRIVSLGGFLLLFVASRLLYLVLVEPSFPLTIGEELYRGTIAQELLTGLKLPFTEYRADNYAGGSLVIGLVASGFFFLLGPTVLALKLAPLLFFTLALVFWFRIIQQYAGERVARYFAILFCFSPPPFTADSLTAMGYHSESVLFSALTVFLLFRMLSEENRSLLYPTLLGLTAGFGLWFSYTYGLTLLAMLVLGVWLDKRGPWSMRVLCFLLGFLVGFSPWVIMNVQNHFAGLVVRDAPIWEHFGVEHLLDDLSNPRRLVPYVFFADIASDDPLDLLRRAVNLLYSLLYLGPILTAGVLRLTTLRSAPAGAKPTRLTLEEFGALYVCLFALAMQLSDFREQRYTLPVYPFLFFLAAQSVARCEDMFPLIKKKIQTVFLTSVVVLSIGSHAPLLSLDRPGYALSAKGYSYALMPWAYSITHTPAGSGDHDLILHLMERPFLSVILPKLPPEDQQELSRAIVAMLADNVPLNGQAAEFARFEQVVPPRFVPLFYYWVGRQAMGWSRNDVEKAAAAVKFLDRRSPSLHHLALIGIYQSWALKAALDSGPESLAASARRVAPDLQPHYWRALGRSTGLFSAYQDPSLSQLNAQVQLLLPRLDPSAQRSFLQGVGQGLFPRVFTRPSIMPAQIERFFPQTYHQSLFEGWGMGLGDFALFSPSYWKGHESPFWTVGPKGLSEKSIAYIEQGKEQFDALFEGPASSALEPVLSQ